MENVSRATSPIFEPESSPFTLRQDGRTGRFDGHPLPSRETTPDAELSDDLEEVLRQRGPAVRGNRLRFGRSGCQVEKSKVLHGVKQKLIKKFKAACLATSVRVSSDDKRPFEKLHSTLRTLERAKRLTTLTRTYDNDGKVAFSEVVKMLDRETALYQKLIKQMPKQTVQTEFRMKHLIPHKAEVENMKSGMDFCDNLVKDVQEHVKAVKNEGRPIADA